MDERSFKLSSHLLTLSTTTSYEFATRHAFLTQAGDGSLPHERLAFWLAQDRTYVAHAYPRFIGSLIASIPFSTSDSVSGTRERHNEDILRVLVGCLDNTVKEVGFFADTAQKWGLDIDKWSQRKETRDYTAEMARVAALGSLEEGLIFLWAMEKVYLDAWTYVKQMQSLSRKLEGDPNTLSAVHSFTENWSSPEFVTFVDKLESLINGLDISPRSELFYKAEDIWRRVVELEATFWPRDGEEQQVASLKQLSP